MIEFVHNSGCKPDLISVGGIARCSGCDELSLRDLPRDSLAHRNRRIRRPGNTHCTVDICPSGKRIADRSADTGCSTAKRLNFCWMVMSLVFKQQQPRLGFPVSLDCNFHRAGIDLFALVQSVKLAALTQIPDCKRCKIHKTYGFFTPESLSGAEIVLIGALQQCVFKAYAVNDCVECGVTAMI